MKKVNIGILGGSMCCPNFGVGALTISQCNILNSIASKIGMKFDVIIYESVIQNEYLPEFSSLDIDLDTQTQNFLLMRKKLSRHDIIIDIYGGDSFSDIYSRVGFFLGAMQRLISLSKEALYILAPQTIGPFKNSFSSLIKGSLLARADSIFLRDTCSEAYIDGDKKNKVRLTTDLAFRLPYYSSSRDTFSVGINVSGLLWNGELLGDKVGNYRKSVFSIIDECLKRNYSVILVPHVNDIADSIDGDYAISKLIGEKYHGKVEVAPKFFDPIQAKTFISGLSVFVGSRMHATIAAVSSGVPTLAIAYSQKFSGVFEKYNYKHVVEKKDIEVDYIREEFFSIIEKYDTARLEARSIQSKANELLKIYDDYLQNCIMKEIRD